MQLINIQAATAWDLMHAIQPSLTATKQDFVAETKDTRLDALENYVRGVTDSSTSEKIRHFKEAVRLNGTGHPDGFISAGQKSCYLCLRQTVSPGPS